MYFMSHTNESIADNVKNHNTQETRLVNTTVKMVAKYLFITSFRLSVYSLQRVEYK